MVEDDFVRQACLQECAAQRCACFDQEFADAAFRQQGEGGGQADAAVGGGDGQDVEMRDGGEGGGVFFGRDGGQEQDGRFGVSQQFGRRRQAQAAVEDDAEGLAQGGEGSDVELEVVGQYGADAGQDGAAFGAQDLYVVSGGFAGNPLAEAV